MSAGSTRSLLRTALTGPALTQSTTRSSRRMVDQAADTYKEQHPPQATTADARKHPAPASSTCRLSFDLDDDLFEDTVSKATLDWRLDPDDSLSDWTIIISDETKSTTYNVHKTVLGVGPRSSNYFSTLFHSQIQTPEMASATSSITLDSSAAEVFPTLLDFIYSGEEAIEMKTRNAVAVRFLSKYFGVRSLYLIATEHVKRTLAPKTAPIYLAEAGYYNDDRLIDAASDVCAENMEHIYVGLFTSLPPELFKRVVLSPRLQCGSEWLSKAVAKYCRSNPTVVDPEFLKDVTYEGLMPNVMAEEAPFLLCMCVRAEEASRKPIVDDDGKGNKGCSGAGPDGAAGGADSAAAETLAPLRQRCIDACSYGWNDQLARPLAMLAPASDDDESARRLSGDGSVRAPREAWHHNLPLPMQIQLLEAALVRASMDVDGTDGRSVSGCSTRRFRAKDDEVQEFRDALTKKDREIHELQKAVRALMASKGRRNTIPEGNSVGK